MPGHEVAALDQLRCFFGNVPALKVVVDLLVGETEFVLVALARVLVEQVRGGNFVVEAFPGAEFLEDLSVLPLVQPEQREDVRAAVAVLGEETGD